MTTIKIIYSTLKSGINIQNRTEKISLNKKQSQPPDEGIHPFRH
jgi:hypothetical protein